MKSAKVILAIFLALGCAAERPSPSNVRDTDAATEELLPAEPELDCPTREAPMGVELGDSMIPLRLPDSSGVQVALSDLCGSKAVLVISSAEWCAACRREFRIIALLAADWQDRGGRVYYSLFENNSNQPPRPEDLAAWEAQMEIWLGEIPFPVLGDPAKFLVTAVGGGTLPMAWVLDEGLVVQYHGQGAGSDDIIPIMNELLQ